MNADPRPTAARKSFGDTAPKLAEITDEVLFGDVWERPELSKRDRSLITCAALVTSGKTEQMNFHFSTEPIGYVGVPHGVDFDGEQLFYAHVHLHGGPAPVR